MLAEWATVASAALASVAAMAAWASVWQNRRERVAAAVPGLDLEVQQGLGTGKITLHISNNGGAAKKVRFIVIEGGEFVYGHPAPTAVFRPGESRLITTSLKTSGGKTARGFVAGFDMSGARFYAWTVTGKRLDYRMRGRRAARDLSDQTMIAELYPDFEYASGKMGTYETVERTM
jgi:hypothetical protein